MNFKKIVWHIVEGCVVQHIAWAKVADCEVNFRLIFESLHASYKRFLGAGGMSQPGLGLQWTKSAYQAFNTLLILCTVYRCSCPPHTTTSCQL